MSARFKEFIKMLGIIQEVEDQLTPLDRLYLRAHAFRPNDVRLQEALEHRLMIHAARKGLEGRLFRVPPQMTGQLLLGYHREGEARAQIGGHQAHILQVGGSGSGKTSNTFSWLGQLGADAQGLMVVDPYKREYRELLAVADGMGKRAHVLRGRQQRLNPLASPHGKIPPDAWASMASDVLAVSLRLPAASRNLLRTCIHDLQEKHGVFAGSDRHPTLIDLRAAIADRHGNTVIRQALLNRLDAVIAELGAEVLGHPQGFPIAELAARIIINELDGLSFLTQNLLGNFHLGALFAWRAACPEERKGPVIFVYEEAQRAFSRRAESSYSEGPSYLSTMASLVRGADITMVVNVQTIEDLASSIMTNSSVKVMGRLGSHEDYERMGRSMGMRREQIESAKRLLRPGLYVAKVASNDFQDPFLLRVPLGAPRRRVSDAEAWESGEELRRELLPRGGMTQVPQALPALPAPKDALTDAERAFMDAVRAHPRTAASRFAGILGISSRKAVSIRQSLVRKGRLKEWRVELTAKGAKTLLMELTEGSAPGRRGSFPHRLGVDLARQRLEAEGYATETEKAVRVGEETGYIDLVGTHRETQETVGVEVETGESDALGNLSKAVRAGLDRVVMLACSRKVDRTVREGALATLSPEELARVTFSTLSDYWDESCD